MSLCPCTSAEPEGSPGAGPLNGLLKNVIKRLSGAERFGEEEMASAWEYAAGLDAARHSRPVSVKKTIVIVNVDNSGWLYELTIQKKKILERLGEKLKGKKIKEIRFRIGEIREAQNSKRKAQK
jgi:predicted nucleic acid-binding Zn ribbon protein